MVWSVGGRGGGGVGIQDDGRRRGGGVGIQDDGRRRGGGVQPVSCSEFCVSLCLLQSLGLSSKLPQGHGLRETRRRVSVMSRLSLYL